MAKTDRSGKRNQNDGMEQRMKAVAAGQASLTGIIPTILSAVNIVENVPVYDRAIQSTRRRDKRICYGDEFELKERFQFERQVFIGSSYGNPKAITV